MRKILLLMSLLVFAFCTFQFLYADGPEELPVFLKNPHLSADGKLITFDYEGDIWTVPVEGGNAKRLTVHLAFERRPYFSPDGKWILYSAAYYGNYDLYIMPVDGGTPRRLTYSPGNDVASGWSGDGATVYFYSFRDDIYDCFKMPAAGGTPVRIAYAQRDYCVGPSASPDGKMVAFNYRSGFQEWNRHGYISPDTADIYVGDNTSPLTNIIRITDNWYQDFLPLWAPDSKTLYYCADDKGTYNLYSTDVRWKGKNSKQITKLKDMGIRWFSVAQESGDIVVEMNHRLHRLNPKNGETQLIPITFYNPPKTQDAEFEVQKVAITDFSIAPDGKKVAYITGHDIFVMASTGGYAKRLTETADRELHLSWAPDSLHVIFSRLVDDTMAIVRIDVRTGEEEILAKGADDKYTPYYTPDGKSIAFQKNYDEICTVNPDGTNEKTLLKGVFARRLLDDGRWFDFSEDGNWIHYTENDETMAYAAMAKYLGDNSAPMSLSPLGGNNWPGGFTKDMNTYIFTNYLQGRQMVYVIDFEKKIAPEKSDIEKLDELLNPAPAKQPEKAEPKKTEEDGKGEDKEKNDEPKTEPKPVEKPAKKELDLRYLIDKTRTLQPFIPMNQYFIYKFKNDTSCLIMAYTGNNYTVFAASLAPDNKRPATPLLTVNARIGGFEVDSNEAFGYYLMDGALYSLNLKTRESKKISPQDVRTKIDEKATRGAVFQEILWLIKTGFYDPNLHGVDIKYLRAKYGPLVAKSNDESTFRGLMDEFISEFNASHMGVGSRPGAESLGMAKDNTPHLGFFYDDSLVESGVLKISRLVENTPAGADNSGLKVGDYVLEINGTKMAPGVNAYECVRNMLGQEVKLVVADSPDAAETRVVYMKTIDINSMFQARINEWETTNRKYVEDKSNGRYGYIHLLSMMDNDYAKFLAFMPRYLSDHDGVVMDFRYNSGGRISHMIAEVLDDKPWLFSKMRGGRWIPEDLHRDFSFQKAVVGLFNYRSFSNAEMMAAGFKIKGLGTTVGTPTAGGVIGTWPKTLLDGSEMRLPRFSIYDLKGRNLELSPTKPDVNIDRDVIDEMAGRDPQLDRAIEELKKEVPSNSERLLPKLPKNK